MNSDMYTKQILLKLTIVFAIILIFSAENANAQLPYRNSLALSAGAYAASGFGTNHFLGLRYNHLLEEGKYFVEAALGFTSIRSKVLQSISNAQIFESNSLYVYEFLFGYDNKMWGNLPFITAGFAGVNQGGQSRFAGVVGIGKRIILSKLFNTSHLGFRYDIRDQIYNQELNNSESFVTHNFVVTLGFEFYY